jgi:DNA-binding LytR/AlgR family response regulator
VVYQGRDPGSGWPLGDIFLNWNHFNPKHHNIMLLLFFVSYNRVLKRIDPAEVIGLFTEGNYTKVVLANSIYYMVRSTLAGAMKKLPPEMFIRIHRSTVVSIYFIDDIAKDHLIIAGESIPIGRQYYKTVISRLNIID